MSKAKFIYILGPTAVGKTELSIQLANRLNWPIVNCDSVQVYKSLNIGTAKPSSAEMTQARHHLFDYVEPPRTLTAADYLADVASLVNKESINQALFVGGSGFYVQALEKGLYPNAQPTVTIKQDVEKWIENEGYEALYLWLQSKDPEFASKISSNDHYRIRRAVEVMKSQNKTMSALKQEMKEINYSPLPENDSIKLGLRLDKIQLRKRVEQRTQKMLKAGFIDEVVSLREKGLRDWSPMNSVGYKEVQLFLDKELKKSELFERIVISTMQLIKKQMTWFKRDPNIQWFESDQIDQALQYGEAWAQKPRG